MKTKDYLETLPVGSVIWDKRTLALFKRLGFIYDYSQWGYLESCFVQVFDDELGNGQEISYRPDPGRALFKSEYYRDGYANLHFTYKGMEFGTKYLDGCFNAYLCKTGGTSLCNKTVNPRISLYGNII